MIMAWRDEYVLFVVSAGVAALASQTVFSLYRNWLHSCIERIRWTGQDCNENKSKIDFKFS